MNTELLLRQSPEDALVAMVNARNHTLFRPGDFIVSDVTAVADTRTTVTLTVRSSSAAQDPVPEPGALEFTYERIPVGEHFSGVLADYRPALPVSTQTVLDEITRRTGQQFYPGEFEARYIDRANAAPFVLTPSPTSLRWVGELSVVLGDFTELSVYLADATAEVFGQVDQSSGYGSQYAGLSQINGTEAIGLLNTFNVGDLAQDNPAVLAFVKAAVASPPTYISQTPVWNVETSPNLFNLRGAKVVAKDAPYTDNPINMRLDRAVVLELDLSYSTAFTDPVFAIPYQSSFEDEALFTDQPRFRQVAVRSVSDGTAHNRFLFDLVAPSIITSVPVGGLMISGDVPWVADPQNPSPTNLYNAVVQYNGQLRPQDTLPLTAGLNRVLVVTVNEPNNTAYRGNISFHYRAPIVIDEAITTAQVTLPYEFDLNPQYGEGPYVTTVTGGQLPPGIELQNHKLVGTPTVRGPYTFTITVSDATRLQVPYLYRLNVLTD